MYINRIKLDVTPGDESKIIHVSQYDKETRNLEFELCTPDDLVLPEGVTAEINGTTPDGTVFSHEAIIEDSVVSVELTEQMTAVAGEVPCTITISGVSDQLMKESFILMVDRGTMEKESSEPDQEMREVLKAVEHFDEIIEAAEVATKARNTAVQLKKQIDEAAEELTQTKNSALNAIETAKKLALGVVDDKVQDVRRMKLNSEEVARKAFKKANDLEDKFADLKKSAEYLKKVFEEMQPALREKVNEGLNPWKTDSGHATTDANGCVYVYLEDCIKEAIESGEYKVFLQEEGEGNVYVYEKAETHFAVKGTVGLAFSWLVIV